MGEGVYVDWVGGVSPSLDLLGDLLRVRWGEGTNNPGVFEGVEEIVQEGRNSIGQTHRGEDTRVEERVAAEGIKKRFVGSGKVGMDP
jgi:hypothetical protein